MSATNHFLSPALNMVEPKKRRDYRLSGEMQRLIQYGQIEAHRRIIDPNEPHPPDFDRSAALERNNVLACAMTEFLLAYLDDFSRTFERMAKYPEF